MASSCYLVLNEFAAHGVKPKSVTVVGIGSSLAQFQNYKNKKGKMKKIKMQKDQNTCSGTLNSRTLNSGSLNSGTCDS